MSKPSTPQLCLLGAITLVMPVLAQAHTAGGEAAGFWSGLRHPASGMDHVAAMLAVGLWGAQLGAPALWVLPVTFPIVMAFGGMLGLIGVAIPGVELGIAASGILLGLMVLLARRPPLIIAAVLVGFFAIFHGHAHGTELPDGANAMLYSVGFVVSTGLIHAAGISIGLLHRWSAGRVVIRLAGLAIAVAGGGYLWSALS